MRRREFLGVLGGATAAWPLAVLAQEQIRRVGVLLQYDQSNPEASAWVEGMREELRSLGWIEGRNLVMEFRWAGTDVKIMQQFAKELVALKPDVIHSSGTPTTHALKRETSTIPIIFGNLVDPIGSGFVQSLAKPGGNITGFVNLEASITGKYLELLREIAPNIKKVAIFYNPDTAPYREVYLVPFRAAASTLGIEPLETPIRSVAELETVMAAKANEPNFGMIAMPDGFNTANARELAALALRYRIPTIYTPRSAARAGGLISYGNDIADNYRRSAGYISRVLRGEKPRDLPVQFPVKFLLVINIKTAKLVGLEVPQFLQQRADEVIE